VKSDLDRLMEERGFDALFVSGPSHGNPVMYYMVNGATVGEGSFLIKKRGEEPVLFVNLMERDEAAKSGLNVIDPQRYDYQQILTDEGGDRLNAALRFRDKVFEDLGVRGKVSIYGLREVGAALAISNAFNARNNGAELVGEAIDNIFETAWISKDKSEIERIRSVGEKTMNVVGSVAEFLQSHRAESNTLVKGDGSPLTVGDVKARMRAFLNDEGIEDPEGAIFSIGRDAAVAHSSGNPSDRMELGKTIIFDIFPREAGGGYFFDFTRTWCLGHAPPEVEKAYRDVMDTFNTVMSEMKAGERTRDYELRTCDLLESKGHPTHRSDKGTQKGYYHSLGHGIGLNVHEPPYFGVHESNPHTLAPGCVVTIEPGVYYPDEGYGIRIEDCCWMNPATGRFEALADYSKELVLPVRQ
jgi:Xaa-Pro aminopeptidase